MNYCKYGCGNEGKYQHLDGSWCCSSHYNKCPAMRKKIKNTKLLESDKNKTKQSRARNLIRKNKVSCKYCDGLAKYFLHNYIYCCSKKAKECPGYHDYMSKKYKKIYIDKPDYLEWQRNHVKELGKNEEVQKKKSDTMKKIHSDKREE